MDPVSTLEGPMSIHFAWPTLLWLYQWLVPLPMGAYCCSVISYYCNKQWFIIITSNPSQPEVQSVAGIRPTESWLDIFFSYREYFTQGLDAWHLNQCGWLFKICLLPLQEHGFKILNMTSIILLKGLSPCSIISRRSYPRRLSCCSWQPVSSQDLIDHILNGLSPTFDPFAISVY